MNKDKSSDDSQRDSAPVESLVGRRGGVEIIGKPNTKAARDARTKAGVYVSIQHQIRDLRKARGWTQTELGKRAGMPANVISRLERPDDDLPTLRTLVRIANAFDVPLTVRFGKGKAA